MCRVRRLPSVQSVPSERDELRDEVTFLRLAIEGLVRRYNVPWEVVYEQLMRYESRLGRASWRLTYVMALGDACREQEKPPQVLSELPVGES